MKKAILLLVLTGCMARTSHGEGPGSDTIEETGPININEIYGTVYSGTYEQSSVSNGEPGNVARGSTTVRIGEPLVGYDFLFDSGGDGECEINAELTSEEGDFSVQNAICASEECTYVFSGTGHITATAFEVDLTAEFECTDLEGTSVQHFAGTAR